MKIFIIVGMPAAGKNVARMYAQSNHLPYFATGDLVRAEVRRRGIEADPANMAAVSNELRGEDGMGVTRMALAAALKTEAPVVIMEGMRSWPEVELVRRHAACVTIAVVAPRSVRFSRMVTRGRSDDTTATSMERDEREIGYGAAAPIALADEYILNGGTLADALQAFNAIMQGHV